jgi:tetratricopeptide (TPR) repeat protein
MALDSRPLPSYVQSMRSAPHAWLPLLLGVSIHLGLCAQSPAGFRAGESPKVRSYQPAIEDPQVSIARLTEEIRQHPKDAGLYAERAGAYFFTAETAKALADCAEAIRLQPANADHFNQRGDILRTAHQYVAAIADHTEAIRLAPELPAPYYLRALDYAWHGEFANAVADLAKNIQLDRKPDGSAHWFMAEILSVCADAKVRDGKKAVELALKACELSAWNKPHYLDTVAAAYAEAGDFEQAIRWHKKALEARPKEWAEDPGAGERLALYQARRPYHRDPWDPEP